MKCPNCETNIKSDSSFCRACGEDVSHLRSQLKKAGDYLDPLSAPTEESSSGFSIDFPKLKPPPLNLDKEFTSRLFGIILILFILSGVSVLAAPKINDYMEVSESLEEAKTKAQNGDYAAALSQLKSTSGKWTLSSTRDSIESLRSEWKKIENQKDKYEEAVSAQNQGNLEEASNLLSQIDESYPNYGKVQAKLTNIKKELENQKQENKGKFSEGDEVLTTGILRVRDEPSTSGSEVVLQPNGAEGTVVDGPEEGGDYTWWEVEYENGYTGWSAQEFLEKAPEKSTKFSVGDVVQNTVALRVRGAASADAELIDTVSAGTDGEILGGPKEADGYWWWRVGYENGSVGWSIEPYLESSSQSAYEPNSQSQPEQTSDKFSLAEEVQTTVNLSVREDSSASANKLTTKSTGSTAVVVGGPEYSDGMWWWRLKYQDGTMGWSVEEYLEVYEGGSTNNNSNDSNNSSDVSPLPNLADILDKDYSSYQDGVETMHSEIKNFMASLKERIQKVKDTEDYTLIEESRLEEQLLDAKKVVDKLKDYSDSGPSADLLIRAVLSLRDAVQWVNEAKSRGETTILKRALDSNIPDAEDSLDKAKSIMTEE